MERIEVSDERGSHAQAGARPEGLPWYRYFYVWLIVALLGTTVSAALWTVAIAFENADSLVRDDWYAEGTHINRRLEKDAAARQLGIGAGLRVDVETGEVWLELSGRGAEGIDALRLELSHPTRAERDRVLSLRRDATGRFRGQLERRIEGRWYAILSPSNESATQWRLSRTLQLPDAGTIELGTGT